MLPTLKTARIQKISDDNRPLLLRANGKNNALCFVLETVGNCSERVYGAFPPITRWNERTERKETYIFVALFEDARHHSAEV